MPFRFSRTGGSTRWKPKPSWRQLLRNVAAKTLRSERIAGKSSSHGPRHRVVLANPRRPAATGSQIRPNKVECPNIVRPNNCCEGAPAAAAGSFTSGT